MELNCAIIDDEPLARECITNYIREVDFLKLVGTGNNPMEFSGIQDKHSVDLLFLDIQMPRMNGMEFLKTLKNPPMVILTTAFPNYALEGFELDVQDYLLKPITFNRFFKAVMKVKSYWDLLKSAPQIEEPDIEGDYIFIKSDQTYIKIFTNDILFVEAMQNYVVFHVEGGKKHLALMPLKKVMQQLRADSFLQVHKSYIVALQKINTLEPHKVQIGDIGIPVSRNYKNSLMETVLKNKILKK